MAKQDPHKNRYGKAPERRESSSASGKKRGDSSAAARPQKRNAAPSTGAAPLADGVTESYFTPQMRKALDIGNRPFSGDKGKKTGPPARPFSQKNADEGSVPKVFGCLAVLAVISLGWAVWEVVSAAGARENSWLTKRERSDEDETGGGSSGPTTFYGAGVGSSSSAAGAASSGKDHPRRANITVRGSSFWGLGKGS